MEKPRSMNLKKTRNHLDKTRIFLEELFQSIYRKRETIWITGGPFLEWPRSINLMKSRDHLDKTRIFLEEFFQTNVMKHETIWTAGGYARKKGGKSEEKGGIREHGFYKFIEIVLQLCRIVPVTFTFYPDGLVFFGQLMAATIEFFEGMHVFFQKFRT